MSKRMFQILDELNVADSENKTGSVIVCSDLVSANTAKGGGHVTIGVPAEIIARLATDNNARAILLIVDYKEYDRVRQL